MVMEQFRSQPQQEKSPKYHIPEMLVSTACSRHEAALEMKRILEEVDSDFENLPRAEKIDILREICRQIGKTVGSTSEPAYNQNRFLADVVALRLSVEERALALGFIEASLTAYH